MPAAELDATSRPSVPDWMKVLAFPALAVAGMVVVFGIGPMLTGRTGGPETFFGWSVLLAAALYPVLIYLSSFRGQPLACLGVIPLHSIVIGLLIALLIALLPSAPEEDGWAAVGLIAFFAGSTIYLSALTGSVIWWWWRGRWRAAALPHAPSRSDEMLSDDQLLARKGERRWLFYTHWFDLLHTAAYRRRPAAKWLCLALGYPFFAWGYVGLFGCAVLVGAIVLSIAHQIGIPPTGYWLLAGGMTIILALAAARLVIGSLRYLRLGIIHFDHMLVTAGILLAFLLMPFMAQVPLWEHPAERAPGPAHSESPAP